MHIFLGLSLDGQQDLLPVAQLGRMSVGPLGMLNFLETQLGLLRVETPQVERILQFRDVLKKMDAADRFYHRSFQADELGTAQTLLAWRDQWHLHGSFSQAAVALEKADSRRLRDMAELEQQSCSTVAPGMGERLAAIEAKLAVRKPWFERLALAEPLGEWPLAWQRVLAQCNAIDPEAAKAHAPETTMLGALQQALLAQANGDAPPPLCWKDDGSLRVVQAGSSLLAARWMAAQWQRATEDDLLLASESGGILDDTLAASNLPRQGLMERSALRPALQVVPLALALLWQPLDCKRLLEFLTHPICPLRSLVRRQLAEHFAEAPGIGQGPAWQQALETLKTKCHEKELDWDKVRDSIRFWLEQPRFMPANGAPIAAVVERLDKLAEYFRGRASTTEDASEQPAFVSAQAQAQSCKRSLQALLLQGEDRVSAQVLQTLIEQATAQIANPLAVAQVGAGRTVTKPGAVIRPADHVMWSTLSAAALPARWPWSATELATLRSAGVALPETDVLLAATARDWQKPVLAARQTLTLVLPPASVERHPLWQMIEMMFDAKARPAPLQLEQCLTDDALPGVAARPLPKARRWLQLPEGIRPGKRAKESYSSLEPFLFNPSLWVLRYSAKLRKSALLDVMDGPRLYGTLSHTLIERYVTTPAALEMDASTLERWYLQTFEQLLDERGAVLRMEGRRADLESLREKLFRGLRQLQSHLVSADVVRVEPEAALSGHFDGGELGGFSDLLLTRRDGRQAVVDMKWSGLRWYSEKLQNNRHLQLLMYGELLRQRTGHWPDFAFFLISDAALVATDREFFPQASLAHQAAAAAGENPAALWQRFLTSWRWRRAQLDAGLIEVVLPETAEDAEPHPDFPLPEDGIELEELKADYNDYRALTGSGAN
ncbi:PD-(D/E)XK nuclease family protein [Crenobacter intestini]|nr:PD-(D/E)XK nuclease family protein [Crenobacter intestini]